MTQRDGDSWVNCGVVYVQVRWRKGCGLRSNRSWETVCGLGKAVLQKIGCLERGTCLWEAQRPLQT